MLAPASTDEAAIAAGREALQRLRSRRTWDDWLCVGRAVYLLRDQALGTANAKRPYGRKYVVVYGQLLQQHGFDSVNRDVRGALVQIVENLDKVEAWRATLPETVRLDWNHPHSVLRHFMAAGRPRQRGPHHSIERKCERQGEQHDAPRANGSRHFPICPDAFRQRGIAKVRKQWSIYGPDAIRAFDAAFTGLFRTVDDIHELLAYQRPRPRGRPKLETRPRTPALAVLESPH